MDACEFFLQEYDTVRYIVNDLFLKGLSDDQIRHQPEAGLNSIAWYLWHTARWQDFANTLIVNERPQLLNEQWRSRMNVSRRDVGAGMTREECTAFNKAVNVAGVRAYWDEVGNSVREVARSVPCDDLCKPVETRRLQRRSMTARSETNGHGGCRPSSKARARLGFYRWRCGIRLNIYLVA